MIFTPGATEVRRCDVDVAVPTAVSLMADGGEGPPVRRFGAALR
ncbi:MAG: hypothetical protein ACOC95_04790 [Planctomycetota bacterium]